MQHKDGSAPKRVCPGPVGTLAREASCSVMVREGFTEEVFQRCSEGRKKGWSKV